MKTQTNASGQTVGYDVVGWRGARTPSRETLLGRFCKLEPLQVERHLDQLFEAQARDVGGGSWTYLSYGPPASREEYGELLGRQQASSDPLFFAIVDQGTGRAVGVASYLRISPELGSIEIGHLYFSPLLQRTAASTEAIFLLLQHAFALGYRRCEWKCDSLNEPSKSAALRYGFTYEGLFRQASVSKGRNRDTTWYAILDGEWEKLGPAFQHWLRPENFDAEGRQRESLSQLTHLAIRESATL